MRIIGSNKEVTPGAPPSPSNPVNVVLKCARGGPGVTSLFEPTFVNMTWNLMSKDILKPSSQQPKAEVGGGMGNQALHIELTT